LIERDRAATRFMLTEQARDARGIAREERAMTKAARY
jgi:hypothetical protein